MLRDSKFSLAAMAVTLALSGVAVAACGSDERANPTNATGDSISVLATTTIWADIARNVGCDGVAEVEALMPAGTDPHAFELSLRDRERLEGAQVVVANGLDLETSLLDVLAEIDDELTIVRAGDHVTVLGGPHDEHLDEHDEEDHLDDDHDHDEDEHGDEHDDGHDHDGGDPHVWFDPTRVAATLPAIGDALVAAGADRSAVDECIDAYTDELTVLDDDLAAAVDALPAERRVLVTNHHSLGYLADRYGFEVIGTVIPSSSSLASTNPADLQALADAIAAAGVPAIFAETQHSSTDTEALADRVGVEVVTLQTDTLGEVGSDTATYLDWLRVTVSQIVGALS